MGSGFYVLWTKVSPHDPQTETQKTVGEEEGQDLMRPVYPLKSLIINLSDHGKTRYLKTLLYITAPLFTNFIDKVIVPGTYVLDTSWNYLSFNTITLSNNLSIELQHF